MGLLTGNLAVDAHFRPQSDFLVYDHYDDWFAFERLADAVTRLREAIGFDVIDTRRASRHGSNQFRAVDTGTFADMPLQQLADMRGNGELPSHAALYDDALVAQAAKLFRADVTLYRSKLGAEGLTFDV